MNKATEQLMGKQRLRVRGMPYAASFGDLFPFLGFFLLLHAGIAALVMLLAAALLALPE